MWLRRAFFWWLIPAAFVLPLWLLIGWIVFGGSGWALLWVLLIAMPSVFLGELVLTLLVRARGTVRAERAVSWWDVLGFGAWHLLTIQLGFFNPAWFVPVLVGAILIGIGLFWSSLWQLWREARPRRILLRTRSGQAYVAADSPTPRTEVVAEDVVVVNERRSPQL